MKIPSFSCTVAILFVLSFYGCVGTDTTQTGGDLTKNRTLVSKAKDYLSGNPQFFIPPYANVTIGGISYSYGYSTGGSNTTGAMAYGYHVPEPISTYRERINNSSVANQTTWSQYTIGSDNNKKYGYPFSMYVLDNATNEAGMVCWRFVGKAMIDAGYLNVQYQDCDWWYQKSTLIRIKDSTVVTLGTVQVGDFVLFDLDNNLSFDHIAIVTNKRGQVSSKDWDAISCLDIYQDFQFGVAEVRIGKFDSSIPNYSGYNWVFVRYNENHN